MLQANHKLSALARIAKHLTIDKRKTLLNLFYYGTIQLLSFNLDVS